MYNLYRRNRDVSQWLSFGMCNSLTGDVVRLVYLGDSFQVMSLPVTRTKLDRDEFP